MKITPSLYDNASFKTGHDTKESRHDSGGKTRLEMSFSHNEDPENVTNKKAMIFLHHPSWFKGSGTSELCSLSILIV